MFQTRSSGSISWDSLVRSAAAFVLHQFIATVGLLFLPPLLTAYVFDILRVLGKPYPMTSMYWILTGTPYYPLQISLGLFLGYLIGRRARNRVMLWVWVLPAAFLTVALLAFPTLVVPFTALRYPASLGGSPLELYFGWGCGGAHPCFDQAALTLPFYAAAAYSIGALLARRAVPPRMRPSPAEFWAFLLSGLVFLAFATVELVLTIRQGWRAIDFGLIAIPAGISVFLTLYAVTLRQCYEDDRSAEPIPE